MKQKENYEHEKRVGNLFSGTGGNFAGNVYSVQYLSPTINTAQGGYRMPLIFEVTKEHERCNQD